MTDTSPRQRQAQVSRRFRQGVATHLRSINEKLDALAAAVEDLHDARPDTGAHPSPSIRIGDSDAPRR